MSLSRMKTPIAQQVSTNTSKAYHFKNIQELITITNGELEDILYIGKKEEGRNCWSDFSFKTKEETIQLNKENKMKLSKKNTQSDFFVYNERTGELVPFKTHDYLMYDRGYVYFDGRKYVSCDDNGNEVNNFFFSNT